MHDWTRAITVGLAALVLASGASAHVVEISTDPDPVQFGRTVQVGLTDQALRVATERGLEIPRVQVFYAQYRFVVGYNGVPAAVHALAGRDAPRRYGPPVAIYVTDFAGTAPRLATDGLLNTSGPAPSWVHADAAHFAVVEAGGDRAIVPFSEAAAAKRFAARHDGRVIDWQAVLALPVEPTTPDRMSAWPGERDRAANATVRAARSLRERPVSVVVGEEARTLQEAIDRAPPNTTVFLPPGTYHGPVEIDTPLTIAGAGESTRISGRDNGTVVHATAPGVAVTDLRIDGVGNRTTAHETNASGWDRTIQLRYGRGDAAVRFVEAPNSLVANVTIETPSNGVVLYRANGSVVDDTTIRDPTADGQGLMGVLAMYSAAVVQDSQFDVDRDAVYTHRASGIVVRDNLMSGGRFGTHLMFTGEALLARNRVRNADTGLVVMTRPSRNVLVGNDVRASNDGLVVAGSDSYVAGNVLVGNGRGLSVESRSSLYEHNVVVGNDVGAHAATLLPSNRVRANDFDDNGRAVTAVPGSLRVWSGASGGNYWADADRIPADGHTLARAYRPTGAIDAALDRPGVWTLSRAPVLVGLRSMTGSVPGMRETGVVDERPLARPANPAVLARVTGTDGRNGTAANDRSPTSRPTTEP